MNPAALDVDTLSTVPGGNYRYYDGTSMSVPHVSAPAGLLVSGWRILQEPDQERSRPP